MKKHELDTPALVVDVAALRRNLVRMQELADGFGVALRPHTKTHKCPELARLQLDAGARGVTVAKLGEAEVLADAGVDDILIANQVVTAEKMGRLVELAGRIERLAVLVDSEVGIGILERAFADAGAPLDVLIEVDTGKGRCGVADLDAILALAERASSTSSLNLRGVETHEGHVASGVGSADEIEARSIAAGRRMVQVAEAVRERGFPVEDVSVGSTPAAPYTASVPGITEMRPGTYVFNDVNQMRIGQAAPRDCALGVLATVISRPAPDRAVLDAGSKALWIEPARPPIAMEAYDGFGYIRESPSARITSLSEEHAVVSLSDGVAFPRIGEKVEVIPNHVCPVVNLHDRLHLVEGEDVAETWTITGRGKVR